MMVDNTAIQCSQVYLDLQRDRMLLVQSKLASHRHRMAVMRQSIRHTHHDQLKMKVPVDHASDRQNDRQLHILRDDHQMP